MKITPAPTTGMFNPRTALALLLCASGASLAIFALAAPSRAQNNSPTAMKAALVAAGDWRAKIDPNVMSAANAGETEFIIYMAEKADLTPARTLATKAEKGTFVYQQLTSVAERTQAPVRSLLAQLGAEYRPFWVANAIWAKGNLAAVEAVAARSEVAAVHSVGKGALQLPPPDQQPAASNAVPPSPDQVQTVTPGLLKVKADAVWAMGYEGQGVTVAGADTGVRFTHDALKRQYRGWGGSAAASVHDYNWHDAIHIPNWPPEPANACNPGGPTGAGQPSPLPCDDDEILGGGHGSHTMGSMVGDDGGANEVGMAPQASWMACRNLSNGVGVIPTYLECMQWFIAPTKIDGTAPDPTKAPHVVNNSWGCLEGCPPEPNPLRDTLKASRAAGIVYVASAGNDGVGEPNAPGCNTIYHPLARYPEAFTVGSTTHTTDTVSDFSSRGPAAADPEDPQSPFYLKPNISAPGSTIRSALRGSDNEYGNLSGTSMAGPHVAGLVALVISANPKLAGNVDRIEDIIEQSAAKKTTTEMCGGDTNTAVPNNTYGWGRIDALAAVNMALAEATPVSLVGVASRKTHGNSGASFDVDLPLSGAVGIESRAGQPSPETHSIVFKFANAVANVGNASVTSGTGSVSSRSVGSNPNEYIVKLSGVTDAQTVRVTLNGVTDALGNSTPTMAVDVAFLIGDTNGDRTTNSGDATQTRPRSGQSADVSNFRSDVNNDGTVNSGDAFMIRTRSGNTLDPTPYPPALATPHGFEP
ncbi:MAG TPA: S8 family serine peptidase [Thermoanaerobaculia bacterium]